MAYSDPLDERARAARRKHYDNNKEQYIRRNQEATRKRLYFMRQVKDVPCMDCNERYPHYVMDFDHRDPAVKLGNVSRMARISWKKLKEEITKCDVVCANCHRERTRGKPKPL